MQIGGSAFLVTGGSSGLGAACAREFVELGGSVVIADLAEPRSDRLQATSERVMFAKADVTDEAALRSALSAGEERFGPIRGVVTCAGLLHAERTVRRDGAASLETFRRVVEINLIGTFNTVRLAAETMLRNPPLADESRGVIVMTSSIAAFEGQIGQAAYSASKGGVASLTLPLARELGDHGIRVVTIAPGVFNTPMIRAAPEQVRQSLISQTPFPHRLGEADDFAALVKHVFENAMLNGCVLRLDGAIRMGAK